ncbi:MAG: flagellar biosynthesis anti-sigma factor FlgM [Spirochaetia bacterium]|jgi:negative regulator of flagellin synthesis FlgM|nr:flagellar biosynthesis anti-sigma factor FlgM [Spirochaetia bacterium]
MTIDKLGSINPVQNYNKTDKPVKSSNKTENDSISVSSEARVMGELLKAAEAVKQSPDIRMDRVEEVKRKMSDPDYINDAVINSVADKIIDMFEI